MKNPCKILFLEDSADDLELMQHELREAGVDFIFRHAVNKKEFVSILQRFQPDVILADYSLPSFSGMQAFRSLEQIGACIPFILITGVLSEQLAVAGLREGVDDFILKSSYKRLPAAIENAIGKREIEKERQHMARELKRSHEKLQLLLKRQQVAREEERINIARDLHDELGQMLTALKIDVNMLRKKICSDKALSPEFINAEFSSMTKLINGITQSLKRIAGGLRPEILDELGLVEAVRWHATEFEKRHKIKCTITLPFSSLEADRNFSIGIFRIVQETLTNVARHAQATEVKIDMKTANNSLSLEISDNGKGFSAERSSGSGSLGIIGLRERARLLNGKFKISSKRGQGTVVSVIVPLKDSIAVVHD